jgi:hypothetical protein
LKPGIIPDEPDHFQISKLFSTTWGIPADSSETVPFAGVNYKPFLFYWVSGRIMNLLDLLTTAINEKTELVVLRLAGVLYSTIAIIFCYLFAKEIIKNRWGQLFVVFLLTNTLMFSFLSGGHNYDNQLNLCSFAGIYYLTLVSKGKSFFQNSLAWLLFILVGSLVKMTMLPLAMITGLVWCIYILKNHQGIDFQFPKNIGTAFVVTLCIVLFGANVFIYGGSIAKYHTLTPRCEQIFSNEQCENYRLNIRDKELRLDKKLTLVDVLINGYPDPIEYGFDQWPALMLERIYGILGHRTYYPNISVFRLLILWGIFLAVRYWKSPPYALGSALIVFFFYSVVLFWKNYNTELIFGFKHVAIQGRYIFPVIGVIYTLFVYYVFEIQSKIVRLLTIELITIIFILYSPIAFLLRFYHSGLSEWIL